MYCQTIDLPESGVLLYESKHQPGESVPEHHHRVHQVLFALNGEGQITLEGEAYQFSKDHVLFITPYSNHSIQTDSKLTVLVLAFDQSALSNAVQHSFFERFIRSSRYQHLNPFVASEVGQLLRKILFEQTHHDSFGQCAILIYLLEIFLLLERANISTHISDANTLRAERIRNYITTHYFEKLSAQSIASMMNISVRYMNDIFKEQWQKTPMQYLTQLRMERAKTLLIETDQDIVSICFEVGYENISTFYRTFKNNVYMSPNRFREYYQTMKND